MKDKEETQSKKPESVMIHPSAIIDPGACIGRDVSIGAYSVVNADVAIGAGCRLDTHVLVDAGSRLGDSCRVFKGAVIGTIPQDLKFEDESSELIIGNRTVIREFCTLNRGTRHGGLSTVVGSDCLIMAYAHVAHDCRIGNHVILANAVNLAGHVLIEDHVSISGLCAIHQFVKIGKYSYIGGMARVTQDVPPFILTTGGELKYFGPNRIGLKRHGFSDNQISSIKKAYRYIFRSKLNISQAVSAIKSELEITEEISEILQFIERSERGIAGK